MMVETATHLVFQTNSREVEVWSYWTIGIGDGSFRRTLVRLKSIQRRRLWSALWQFQTNSREVEVEQTGIPSN